MMLNRKALLAAAALAAIAVAAPLVVGAEPTPQLTWTAEAAKDEAGAPEPGKVQFQLSYRADVSSYHSVGRKLELGALSGLSTAQFGSDVTTTVRFRLTRDAGAFDCQGSARAQLASGLCDFAPSDGFRTTLSTRGVGMATDGDLMQLAMADVGVAYLDELRRQKYPTPVVAELVSASHHGVSLKYLAGMDAEGYHATDLAALSRLRDHGVTPKYMGELQAAGYGKVPLEDLVRLRDHGVSARYLGEVKAAGLGGLPLEDLVRMRDHGVSGAYISALQAAGYSGLSADRLIYMRDHGVSAGYVQGLQSIGYTNVAPDQLVRMRDHGVTADFIRRYTDGQRMDIDALIRLRDRGGRPD